VNIALAEQLKDYDASALAEAIQLRKLSAIDVVEAHFERIEKLNKKYNALVTLDKSRAIQRAKEADRDLAQGKLWGPLHGVPVTIKDSLQTAGLRTTVGYKDYSNFVPDDDAWVVKKLRDAGAIVIGKTNCSKLCGDIQTTNKIFGTTNNPWNVERTSGGSSGGEAAAVALGLSPLGIGSDTGGSIRVPASYCGVFGLKPSIGRIPRDGLLPLHSEGHARPDSLTVVGPMARSIRDLILCYQVLTDDWIRQADGSARPKIYWTHEFGARPIDDEVARVLDGAFSALVDCGVDLVKVEPPLAFEKVSLMYSRLHMFEFMPKESSRLVYYLFWFFESMRSILRGGVDNEYRRLKQAQSALSCEVEVFMNGCDCWALPATPSVAFRHQHMGLPIPLTLNGRIERQRYFGASAGLAYPFNLLGNPSVVIPLGRNKDGLPIAIQLVGKLGEDRKLLQSASYLAEKINVLVV